jgi:transposase
MIFQRKSRLKSLKQSKHIEHFVAGTTARAAAEIIEVQANTAIQFYRKRFTQPECE